MRTPTGFLEWVDANPRDTGVDGEAKPSSWAGKCVALVRRASDFPISNTAKTAQLAHDLTVRNGHPMAVIQNPPRGWFVYFSGPTAEGHVGMSTGDGSFCSATSFLPGAVGIMPIADYARKPRVAFLGASPYFINLRLEPDPEPKPTTPDMRRTSMTTNYVDTSTYTSGSATATTVYGMGGDSPGTPANWREYTRGTALGTATDPAALLNTAHGPHIPLNHADFLAVKAAYLAPLAVSGGGSGSGLTTAEHNQLFDIPTKPELAAVLTTQTGDINTHTTEAVNGITLTSAP